MKITPLFVGAIASFAAIGSVIAADAVHKAGRQIEVTFASPEKYTDVRDGYTPTDVGRQGILDQIRDYMKVQGQNYVPAGQTLSVTFTDIDLAGDFEPWRGGTNNMDIRVIKDVYPPRIDLTFRLTGPDGAVIKEGKRQLRNLAFMADYAINPRDTLRYEKKLLEDWFKNDIEAKKG